MPGEVWAALIGGFIAGLVGVSVAFLQHHLDRKAAKAAASDVLCQTTIKACSDISTRSFATATILTDRPMHDLGQLAERQQLWAAVEDDVAVIIRDAAWVGTALASRDSTLEATVTDVFGVWLNLQRSGYQLAYATGDVVKAKTVYIDALIAMPPIHDAFAEAFNELIVRG